jgi:hypothetical protein
MSEYLTLAEVRRPLPSVYFAGLDLGQAHDFTALALIERADLRGDWDPVMYAHRRLRVMRLRHVERMPLGMPYPEMVRRVEHVMGSSAVAGTQYLAVDGTGVGRPVVDLLRGARMGCRLWPVTITGGDTERLVDGFHRVPKRDLIAGLQVMLQAGQLQIASGLHERETLVRELSEMRVAVDESGRDSWRSGAHDDLVFAVALACWAARRTR